MRIVVALGGNALLERGQRPDADLQERNVFRAVHALVPLAREHELIITHGNGPQVGVLAMESADDRSLTRPYPFDALGAETQGLIGYWLAQDLGNALPDRQVVALVTQTVVDREDPAFSHPTKLVGPVYQEEEARLLAEQRGWAVARDGNWWRRVVSSPEPCEIVELAAIERLVNAGVVVVCAGGGGIPVSRDATGALVGIEAVVDKDLTAALLAEQIGADVLLLLTDVSAVEVDHGGPEAKPIGRSTPSALRSYPFAAGSMGPKVDAACRFVERTGGCSAIGSLDDAVAIVTGDRGTCVVPDDHAAPAPVYTPVVAIG
jgi:carbamate kinase